jgi:enamine deaminase RidA (YjgF/YER057c/UK114 family)
MNCRPTPHSVRRISARLVLTFLVIGGIGPVRAAEPIVTAVTTYIPLEGAVYSSTARVAPDAALIFVSGTDAPDAAGALGGLTQRLALAGAGPADLVNVRGSLFVAPGETLSMEAWNAAWNQMLAPVAHRPTRTTLGTVALATPSARVNAEGVAARPFDAGAPLVGEATPNPRVRRLGTAAYGSAAATLVLPGTGLVFTAGILADPIDATQPENAVARYGDMKTQAASVMDKLEQTLRAQQASWDDIFYVRALLSPVPGETAVDFAGFGEAFAQAFSARNPLHRPALTVWAAPGFNTTGRIVEVEVYAAARTHTPPPIRSITAPPSPAVPLVRAVGAPSAIISSSAAIPGARPLVWFAGVIGTGGGIHDEAVTALLALRSRAEAAGTSLADTIYLRAYPVVGDDFPGNFARWNEAYSRFFNLPGINPHKPARTAFPVTSLPMGKQIEVEILAVGR